MEVNKFMSSEEVDVYVTQHAHRLCPMRQPEGIFSHPKHPRRPRVDRVRKITLIPPSLKNELICTGPESKKDLALRMTICENCPLLEKPQQTIVAVGLVVLMSKK